MSDNVDEHLMRAIRESEDEEGDELFEVEGLSIRKSNAAKYVAGHLMPLWVEATISPPLEPVVRCRIELIDDVPRVTELSFTSPPGHREVKQKDLRDVVLSDVVDEVYGMWVIEVDLSTPGQLELIGAVDGHQLVPEIRRFLDGRRTSGKRRIDTALLTEVARVYRENVDHAPTEAVARTFGVKHRMASNYVSKARERGLLPPTKQGRAQA